MSERILNEPGDERLGALLRAARPAPELPPGFERQVWQRIERSEPRSGGILDWVVSRSLTPRAATAGLALVIVLAAGAGAARGLRAGERESRDRYIASVDPSYLPR